MAYPFFIVIWFYKVKGGPVQDEKYEDRTACHNREPVSYQHSKSVYPHLNQATQASVTSFGYLHLAENHYIYIYTSQMKKLLILLIISILSSYTGSAGNLGALFSHKTFYSPSSGSYLEAYLSVNAGTVVLAAGENGKYSGSIQIIYTFSKDGKIVYHDKYNLLSQEVDSASGANFNFLDQKRVQLANGTYQMELQIKDNNDPDSKPYSATQNVVLEYYNNIAAISDIELVESYTKSDDTEHPLYKNGFEIVPYADNFYPSEKEELKFYAEIYNTPKVLGESSYLVQYFIRNADTKVVMSSYSAFKKQEPRDVNILIGQFPIKALPSGNYQLVVELRNQQNDMIASREVFFQRSNTIFAPAEAGIPDRNIEGTFAAAITDTDSLVDYIKSIRPIANQLEVTFMTNQLRLADTKLMQQFLYDFWVKRNPIDPQSAFTEYNKEVIKVNNSFSTNLTKGYDTERGRVYLQYGAPNTISRNYNEPSAYPYEIWHYYKIGTQTNKRFVFYNPDLVSDEFILLHSDMQGEVSNYQWENMLYIRDTQTRDIDQEGLPNADDYFGNRARDNYINPR